MGVGNPVGGGARCTWSRALHFLFLRMMVPCVGVCQRLASAMRVCWFVATCLGCGGNTEGIFHHLYFIYHSPREVLILQGHVVHATLDCT